MSPDELKVMKKIHKAVHDAAKTVGIFHPAKPDLEKALGLIMELVNKEKTP